MDEENPFGELANAGADMERLAASTLAAGAITAAEAEPAELAVEEENLLAEVIECAFEAASAGALEGSRRVDADGMCGKAAVGLPDLALGNSAVGKAEIAAIRPALDPGRRQAKAA